MILSVVIVSYNTKELTLQALQSSWQDAQNSALLKDQTEWLVVDNDSKDDSVAALKAFAKSHANVTILTQEENLGFGRANNVAVAKASGQFVFFLNSDTIVEDGAQSALVLEFQKKSQSRLGLLAAGLKNADGTYQAQGGDTPSLLSLAGQWLSLDDIPLIGAYMPSTQHTGRRAKQFTHFKEVGWVAGTALMVRTEVLSEIGSFDPAIFLYAEDVELCVRARHHLWRVGVLGSAFVVHLGSASSSSKTAVRGEVVGMIYLWSKHFPSWQLLVAKAIISIGCFLRYIVFTMTGHKQRGALYSTMAQQLLIGAKISL